MGRQFPPRPAELRRGIANRQAFGGSAAGSVRNASLVRPNSRSLASGLGRGDNGWRFEDVVITDDTTASITLSAIPRPSSLRLDVNGICALQAIDFTVAGAVVTFTTPADLWLGLATQGPWSIAAQYQPAIAAAGTIVVV